MQATLDAVFSSHSLPEASISYELHTSEEPHTREEPPTNDEPSASDEPQPSMSTGGFTCPNVLLLPSSDVDDPGVV